MLHKRRIRNHEHEVFHKIPHHNFIHLVIFVLKNGILIYPGSHGPNSLLKNNFAKKYGEGILMGIWPHNSFQYPIYFIHNIPHLCHNHTFQCKRKWVYLNQQFLNYHSIYSYLQIKILLEQHNYLHNQYITRIIEDVILYSMMTYRPFQLIWSLQYHCNIYTWDFDIPFIKT